MAAEQYFTNIAANYKTWGYYIKFDSTKSMGGILLICQNTTVQVYGAWIKRYCVLCLKTYNTSHSPVILPSGSQQATRGARICEMSLLCHAVAEK